VASSFESIDRFRAHCGEPTMPLERCPICTAIPERCYRDRDRGDDTAPAVVDRLAMLVDGPPGTALLRCPDCHRLYYCCHEYAAPAKK
jgi:hypothetical protein